MPRYTQIGGDYGYPFEYGGWWKSNDPQYVDILHTPGAEEAENERLPEGTIRIYEFANDDPNDESWVDKKAVQDYVGSDEAEWNRQSKEQRLMDAVAYYGTAEFGDERGHTDKISHFRKVLGVSRKVPTRHKYKGSNTKVITPRKRSKKSASGLGGIRL